MKLQENDRINVEAVMQQLLQQKTIQQPFRLDITQEQAQQLLLGAYQAEVASRGRKMELNAETNRLIAAVSKTLTSASTKFGLIMCGTCGNGKTTMMYAMQSAISIAREQDWIVGENKGGLRIVDARELISIAKDDTSFAQIKDKPLLGIEDIGREATEVMEYGNVICPLIELLEHRYNRQLYTAITTNLTAEQIRSKYGARIADRFNEMLHVLIFKGKSFRR